jgi:hypothetical protein
MPRQSYLSLSTPESTRRSKKVINRQSLSPVKQRRLSSAVSTPMLNDDLSEKLVRTTNRRNVLNEINKTILASVATPRRTIDAPNKDAEDNSAYSTPRVPILSNFEEWMKLATDNVCYWTRDSKVSDCLTNNHRKSTPRTAGTSHWSTTSMICPS